MSRNQMVTVAIVVIATLILADRLRALPLVSKLPTV
jgi:hypothetical protein